MIIDGTSLENIEKGLIEVFGIELKELQKKINLFRVKSCDGMSFDSDKFKKECYTFIANNKKSVLEEIYVYHLGRHITVPKELRPLPYLLTTKNSLTTYLALKDISFTYQDRMLTLIYKGRTINKSEIYDENRFENHCRLAKRFGYFDVEDFCINGFGFAADIEKEGNSYFNYLQLAPELLQDLDYFLETDLCNDFNKISKFYVFSLKASIDDIVFDGREQLLTRSDKEAYYLYKCMSFLSDCYSHSNFRDNPIIRFQDDKTVKVEKYMQVK